MGLEPLPHPYRGTTPTPIFFREGGGHTCIYVGGGEFEEMITPPTTRGSGREDLFPTLEGDIVINQISPYNKIPVLY